MAESIVQLPAPTVKLRSWNRTVGANSVDSEAVWLEDPHDASYTFTASQILTTTAASHMIQIMAGASLNVRVHRIMVRQHAAPAGVNSLELQVVRLTTAGTGGTAITPSKMDNSDGASGATAQTLPTVKGTEGAIAYSKSLWLGTVALGPFGESWDWPQHPHMKPLIIPAGAANGIALKNVTGIATSTLVIVVELTETSFV